jgi:hypothetical protein
MRLTSEELVRVFRTERDPTFWNGSTTDTYHVVSFNILRIFSSLLFSSLLFSSLLFSFLFSSLLFLKLSYKFLCLTKHLALKAYWGSGGIAPLIL